jgi:vacuolar-type H+-ATPase subunit C/Vma6
MIYYANGVASAKSNDLVSLTLLEQMTNAKDFNSCLSLLSSTPLFVGIDENNIDDVLLQKKQELYDFIRTDSPFDEITNFFLLAQDFDNLGVLCRLASAGKKYSNTSFVKGLSSIEDLNLLCQVGGNCNIPSQLSKAFSHMPKDMSLSQIDLHFKQKKYETLKALTKSHIMKIVLFNILDLQNIGVVLRAKSKEEFEKNKVATGNLSNQILLKLFNRDKSVLYNLSGVTKDIASLVFLSSQEKAYEKIDKLSNELPLLSLSSFAKDTDSIAPFLEYCFLYLVQLKNIKMILSLKRNDVKCNLLGKLLGVKYYG